MIDPVPLLDFKRKYKTLGENLRSFIKSTFDKHFANFDAYDVFRNINDVFYVVSKDGCFGYGIGEMQARELPYCFLDKTQHIRDEQRFLSRQDGFESDFDSDFMFDKDRNLCGFRFRSKEGNEKLMEGTKK